VQNIGTIDQRLRHPEALFLLLAKVNPIPGTRNMDHLTENLGAIHVELTPVDLREIETASSAIKVHGGRMNEGQMKVVDGTGATR
jgi:diketogulonate reductase-like aldo/keto reductase